MATKKKTAKKKTYTVRIEWQVTYYCDTTVEASSVEEAAKIALEDPDYDNQRSYDESGDSTVKGVCEGEGYRFEDRVEVGGVEADSDLRDAARAVVAAWEKGDLAGAVRMLAAALDD